jgi:diguanylate cyclase (GGDEF)-like protein
MNETRGLFMSDTSQDQLFSEDNDELIFAEEDDSLFFAANDLERERFPQDSWKLLIVDDEVEIHDITKLALRDFTVEGKSLTFLSAFSSQEAKQIIQDNSDVAMILLDVVMETEDAGLEVVKYIRDVLKNHLVRIILRTGQPGQFPEDVVIINYDINDYKSKTELTTQKLFTTVVTTLRVFRAFTTLEVSKRELEKVALENTQLYRQLEEYSHTLEQKVIERTLELQVKNQQLKQEIQERQRAEAALQKANQELQRLAILDSLTQIANRRRLDQYLGGEWLRLQQEQKPLSLILCDVDYFKLYNDTYGHQAGDSCLKKVAGAISCAVQHPEDLVARYGGEEFAVVLSNTNLEAANLVVDTIRMEIQQLRIAHSSSLVSEYITVSMGVVSLVPQKGLTVKLLIAAADKALYEAKQQGRDRAIVYSCEWESLKLSSLIE